MARVRRTGRTLRRAIFIAALLRRWGLPLVRRLLGRRRGMQGRRRF